MYTRSHPSAARAVHLSPLHGGCWADVLYGFRGLSMFIVYFGHCSNRKGGGIRFRWGNRITLTHNQGRIREETCKPDHTAKDDRTGPGMGWANTWFNRPSQDSVLAAEFCAQPLASVHLIVMLSWCCCVSGVPKRLPHTCSVPCLYSRTLKSKMGFYQGKVPVSQILFK